VFLWLFTKPIVYASLILDNMFNRLNEIQVKQFKFRTRENTIVNDKKFQLPNIGNPILEVSEVYKSYKNTQVLRGISFTVNRGEIFGILGPNGAGKTTLLSIIELLEGKTSGSIAICGKEISINQVLTKQLIGVQLQSNGFYPGLNLIAQLKFIASLYGAKINPQELLEFVNLWDFRYKKFEQMSGGQRQRFAICAALVNNPAILILDEPTASLDVPERYNIWDLVLRLKRMGKTILLITHYMNEAEALCEKLVIMRNGSIIARGTPEGLLNELKELGVKPKLGSISMEDVYLYYTTGESL
jgi:ABC-2 type transport system ATP-binding protein